MQRVPLQAQLLLKLVCCLSLYLFLSLAANSFPLRTVPVFDGEAQLQKGPVPIQANENVIPAETAQPKAKATSSPSKKRKWDSPLERTRVTSNYGIRVHPISGDTRFHNGVDLAAKLNQSVHAVLDGKVIQAGPRGGLGLAVEISHPTHRSTTIYGHLNSVAVRKGERVKAGTVIGFAGSTGLSTGVHVHFMVKQQGHTVEPLAFLDTLPGFVPSRITPRVIIASAPQATIRSKNTARKSAGKTVIASKQTWRGTANTVAKNNAKVAVAKSESAKTPVKPSPEELSNARSQLAQAEADYQRFAYLFQEGAVSRVQSEQKASERDELKKRVEALSRT